METNFKRSMVCNICMRTTEHQGKIKTFLHVRKYIINQITRQLVIFTQTYSTQLERKHSKTSTMIPKEVFWRFQIIHFKECVDKFSQLNYG